jgi:hypothetical protein
MQRQLFMSYTFLVHLQAAASILKADNKKPNMSDYIVGTQSQPNRMAFSIVTRRHPRSTSSRLL